MKRLLGVLVTVAVVLVLASCASGEARLEVLRSDPMANYDLPNALSVRVTETPGNMGPGITTPARITRTFTVADGTVLAELDVIAEAARGEGWNLEERIPTGYGGNKTIDGLYSRITIKGIDSSNVVWFQLSTRDS